MEPRARRHADPQVEAARRAISQSDEVVDAAVFLEPTVMFGTAIFGLVDPNGHKLYLCEEAGFRAGA